MGPAGYRSAGRGAALCVIAACLVTTCAAPRPPSPARLTRDGFTRLFQATVSIRVALPGGRYREGAGFVATRDGWVATSHHVVGSDPSAPLLQYYDGSTSSVEAIYDWPTRDLAVIVPRVPPAVEPLRLGDSDRVEPGATLFACGVPFGLGRTITRGVVDGRAAFESPRYVVWDGIVADGPSYPGDSGGPVVDRDGRVVGIHLGSVTGERRAVIPSALIRRTLGEARVRAEIVRRRRARESASL